MILLIKNLGKKLAENRFYYYLFICLAYLAITIIFEYSFGILTVAFLLIIFLIVSEFLISNHKPTNEKIESKKVLKNLYLSSFLLTISIVTLNLLNFDILNQNFNIDQKDTKKISGQIVKNVDGADDNLFVKTQNEIVKFYLNYKSNALDLKKIDIPNGEPVTISYIVTNQKVGNKSALLVLDVRNNDKVFLEHDSQVKFYETFKSNVIKTISLSTFLYILSTVFLLFTMNFYIRDNERLSSAFMHQ